MEASGQRAGILAGLAAVTFIGHRILKLADARKATTQDGSGNTYVIPCCTTHTRLMPQKHSFSYSYPVIGTTVGFSGNVNGIVSVDTPGALHRYGFGNKAWFDVDPVDHLQRGYADAGLRGKLDDYLRSQDIDPSQYPHAYLVTAARLLSHQFNPVSFWFLYTSEKVLSAMVMEFHNIFGEKHPYLVKRDFEAEAKHILGTADDPSQMKLRPYIEASWQKDFHMSLFNSRKGSYSVLARDPLGTNLEGFLGIDITIKLMTPKEHPKLVTRLFSVGDAIDPNSLAYFLKMKYIANWLWAGLFTLPKFAKESAILFCKHKLHIWYRPEPLKGSVGRIADGNERKLERAFREYLRFLVEQSPGVLEVRYISSGIEDSPEEIFRSRLSSESSEKAECATIKILTPSFYSRFVHYAHDSEAIFCELAASCTVWLDRPDLLPKIFLKKPTPPLHISSLSDYLFFQVIRRLRCRPRRIERPMTSAFKKSPTTHELVDIRGFRISSMDAFVLSHCNVGTKDAYKFAVAKLFIANCVAFGSVVLLELLMLVGRIGLSWMLTSLIS